MRRVRSVFTQLASGDFVTWCFPVIGLLILLLIPILISQNSAANPGFTVIAGSVMALTGSLLAFLAFWVYDKRVQEETVHSPAYFEQASPVMHESIESRFHELLRIHRTNTSAIRISNKLQGQKVFISMFNEYKCCYHVLRLVYLSLKDLKLIRNILVEQDLVNISYIIFFTGISEDMIEIRKGLLGQYESALIEKYLTALKKLQKKHTKEGHITVLTGNNLLGIRLTYKPFCGHMLQLENYYRHLFQTVKFIVEHEHTAEKEKYELLRVLRAQLTGHEQLMLYYNSLSVLGKPWIENRYFTEYRMIKNLPLPLADFGEKPKDKLGETNSRGELLFEWDELSFRNKYFRPVHYSKAEQN